MHANLPRNNLPAGLVLFLLVSGTPGAGRAQDPSWKTYTDTVHRYEFRYPPDCVIRGAPGGFYLTRGDRRTEFYIEDWTRPVSRGTPWDFPNLAGERIVGACSADGPDCSINCTLKSAQEVPNPYGLRVVGVTRNLINTCRHGPPRILAPAFAVDLSTNDAHYLLIIAPRLGDQGVAPEVLQAIVATIRRDKR
jgi:hypothetical protein